jgi:hypothetical protein
VIRRTAIIGEAGELHYWDISMARRLAVLTSRLGNVHFILKIWWPKRQV